MRIGVIGGGINGVCTAWELALSGHEVVLFERDRLMRATSSASSKLLHGGLRYLEHGQFRLVREALHERAWWLEHAPELCAPIEICLPIYAGGHRSRWRFKVGLWLYDVLAGSRRMNSHRWVDAASLCADHPQLRNDRLRGGYLFTDGQMDDYRLGIWAAREAEAAGVKLRETQSVLAVDVDGSVRCTGTSDRFDHIVNVAGPWAGELLQASNIASDVRLDLVKGSHLLLECDPPGAFLLEHPGDHRVFFVLPYQGRTLVGTTEARHRLADRIVCSDAEIEYLLAGYNAFFVDERTRGDIASTFAGVRPLIQTADDPSRASREYTIETRGCLTTVFGGKWTTARALARKTVAAVNQAHRAHSNADRALHRHSGESRDPARST